MSHRLRWLLVAALLASACSPKQKMRPAGDLWQDANEAYNADAYELAIENYKKLLDQYPFDDRAEEAELRIAYAYFYAERYEEATAAFQDFERMHPTSRSLAAVEYHRGLAALARYRTTDRDESSVTDALGSFRNVIDRFPGTPWAARAELRVRECREALARKEQQVAQYYLDRKSLRAAEGRLRQLLEDYPETDAAADGLARFAQAYQVRGEDRAATLALSALVQDHPDMPEAADAREQLAARNDPLVVDARAQLIDELNVLGGEQSRQSTPHAVSAYPERAGSGEAGY